MGTVGAGGSSLVSILAPAPEMEMTAMAPAPGPAPAPAPAPAAGDTSFHWTAGKVALSLFLFLAAGVAEIAGGWLVWQTLRVHRPWYLAVAGAVVLIIYGVLPTFQPMDSFGRVYAIYGGFFILLSYLWGWAVDGDRPDVGDWVGTGVALVGVLIAMFWPR